MAEISIRIAEIELWGRHGLEEPEEHVGGPFRLTIEATYPEPERPLEDTLDGRPDYGKIALRAAEKFSERRYRLVEPLAAALADDLLAAFPELSSVRIAIRKLRPVLPLPLSHVEVSVARARG